MLELPQPEAESQYQINKARQVKWAINQNEIRVLESYELPLCDLLQVPNDRDSELLGLLIVIRSDWQNSDLLITDLIIQLVLNRPLIYIPVAIIFCREFRYRNHKLKS